jgi:hypothetical protein
MSLLVCIYLLKLLAGGEQVKGEQEAIDIINDRSKPLAAYVFTSKKEVEERMVASISSGGMIVNDTVMHVSSLPPNLLGPQETYNAKLCSLCMESILHMFS